MTTTEKKNQKGFSLIEMVVATGVLAVVGVIAASVAVNLSTTLKSAPATINVEEVRAEIIGYINNEIHWAKTLSTDSAFSCIQTATDCNRVTGEFSIYNANGTRLNTVTQSSGAEANLGFTTKGLSCSSFSAGSPVSAVSVSSGSDDCPFKYTAKWIAVCPVSQDLKVAGGASGETICRNPLIDIYVTLNFAPQNRDRFGSLNVDKLRIHITKTQVGSDLKKLCDMVNGTIIGGICTPNSPTNCTSVCPPTQPVYVTGFKPDGTPNCECGGSAAPVTAQTCATGQVLQGINVDGTLNCATGLLPVLTSSGAIGNAYILRGT